MLILYKTLLIWMNFLGVFSAISVNKVVVRVPNQDDIGLIFDLTICNTQTQKKELLEYRIRSDGTCCVNITCRRMLSEASRIVGGNFGFLEVGAVDVVSLIWPTVSLYNRVGFCPIVITSTNIKGEEVSLKQLLHFDTRFTTLDPDARTLRKRSDFKDCKNWDKEYFKNCTPVNCEERYFGRRSFYNSTSERCEEVVRCAQPHLIYNIFANECIDSQHFCNENDIKMIREGKFKECDCQSSKSQSKPNLVVSVPVDHLNSKRATQTNDRLAASGHKPVSNKPFSGINGNGASNGAATNPLDASQSNWYDSIMNYTTPYWLKGLMDGLVIVFATITIYVLICFGIFLIVSWISRRSSKSDGMNRNGCIIDTPAGSDDGTCYTPSSVLSKR